MSIYVFYLYAYSLIAIGNILENADEYIMKIIRADLKIEIVYKMF